MRFNRRMTDSMADGSLYRFRLSFDDRNNFALRSASPDRQGR
jgi:hypothetical protein